jgi:hypothetical protein
MIKRLQHIPLHVSRRVMGYFGVAIGIAVMYREVFQRDKAGLNEP